MDRQNNVGRRRHSSTENTVLVAKEGLGIILARWDTNLGRLETILGRWNAKLVRLMTILGRWDPKAIETVDYPGEVGSYSYRNCRLSWGGGILNLSRLETILGRRVTNLARLETILARLDTNLGRLKNIQEKW